MAGGDDEDERAKRGKTELKQDMIIEILLRLPAESLAQFKFVSRFWYDFIRSRYFINMYQNRNFNPKKQVSLYCRFRNPIPCGATISFRFYDKIVDLSNPCGATIPIVPKIVRIVGCSNGVVCLSLFYKQDEFLLWNPATKEIKRVPKLLNVSNPSSATRFTSGFWYDIDARTFKVVTVKFSSNGQEKTGAQVHIFSSADSSWRLKELVLDDVPICSCIELQTVHRVKCVKRCMYWLTGSLEGVVDGQLLDHTCLLCFDMVDEVFKRVALPRLSLHFHISIASYKDSLAMFVMQKDGLNTSAKKNDMWVMNDCCERNQTWTKQKTFRGVDLPMGFYGEDENNNWKVVEDLGTMDYYLFDERTGKRADFFKNERPCQLLAYHETLAPLN